MKTVAIFGSFDGIHEGHKAFIAEARTKGDHLVAIVARDSIVERLKGKMPVYNEADRIKTLLEIPEIDLVLLGDNIEGEYRVLRDINPDLIFLGYDQEDLSASIKIAIESGLLSNIPILFGSPHEPEKFHSSILNASHESQRDSDENLSEL